jgi:EmrB/QacA subfamily drug resistance transporter
MGEGNHSFWPLADLHGSSVCQLFIGRPDQLRSKPYLSNVRDWFFAQRCGLVVGRNAVNTGRTASARIAGKKINEDSLPDTSARRTTMVWSIVATVCIGAFMGQLDASITQLVLPALEHKFSASIAEASWVAVMYLLVISVMLPIFGRLADMHGRKTLYVAGLVVFVAGSAMCGFASSLAWLIMTRALQAVGAAMLSANSVAIIVSVAGEKLRGRALGIMSAVQAVGLCAGPTVGGWIVDTLDWRWVFWVNVPFGIAAAALASFVIPEMSAGKPGSRFDTIGAVLLAPGLGALMLAINQVGSWGLTSLGVTGAAATGAMIMAAFIVWEHRSADPLVPLALFRKWPFTSGNLVSLLAYIILFGLFFLMPFAFERIFKEDALSAGLRLTTIPIALAMLAPIAGVLSDRLGSRVLCTAGMLIAFCGLLLLFVQLGADRPNLTIVTLALAIVGVGEGVFIAPNNNAIMGSAPISEAGQASSLMNLTRNLGTSVGIAMSASLLSWQLNLVTGGSSSTFDVSEVDLTGAIRSVLIVLAVLPLLAAALSWIRPARPTALRKP